MSGFIQSVASVVVGTRLADDEGYGSGVGSGMGTTGTRRRACIWGGGVHWDTPLSYGEPTLLVNWLEKSAFTFPSLSPYFPVLSLFSCECHLGRPGKWAAHLPNQTASSAGAGFLLTFLCISCSQSLKNIAAIS